MENLDKSKWYEQVAGLIEDNVEEFYEKFYKDYDIVKTGKGFRLEPCPMCSHRDCCTFGEAVHCFSCNWSGTHINAWIGYATNVLGITRGEAIQQLEDYTSIPYPESSEKDIEMSKKNQRLQQIYRTAETFYHNQLLESKDLFECKNQNITPLEYLSDVRFRKMETVTKLKIGFSQNYLVLRSNLKSAGFSDEEIKESKVWLPEGLFVFFYRNPTTKDIVRINTKNPFKCRYKNFDDNGNESLGEVIQGHSVGSKAFLFSPKFNFKDPFVVVEGEHDLASLMENGCNNVCCIGGNVPEGLFETSLSLAKSNIYAMFDNDEKGQKYLELINKELPHKNIYSVNYNEKYKDPDEYWREDLGALEWKELVKNAEQLKTEEFKIYHQGQVWSAENRHKRLDFVITGKKESGQLIGKATLYVNGEFTDRADDKALQTCKRSFTPMSWKLADAIDAFFNRNIDKRSDEELIAIYENSNSKQVIIKTLADRVYSPNNNAALDSLVSKIKAYYVKINKPYYNFVDTVSKEVNSIENNNITKMGYSRMMICQHFSPKDNKAYMYYTVIKHDGDAVRRLPYLLRNDGTPIRLDILKRKDSQCLILIDNKYELPEEVKNAVFDLESCSLTQEIAEKYINGLISPEELCPKKLVDKLTEYIKTFYYNEKDGIYETLAIFCFTTYFYTMFVELPYFHISGHQGSGKTALDATFEMFCFNASRAVSTSEAALFRKTAIDGGTVILDETENMTTRNKVQDSERAAILKGGYSKSNKVWRYNVEKEVIEAFEVYGPKVMSNIFGIEDVLMSRCIPVNSEPAPSSVMMKLKSPTNYYKENIEEIKELTGRLCLCAMETFQKVYAIFSDKDSLFETDTPRLTQIMNPLLAVARLVDIPEKEKLLMENPGLDPKTLVGTYEAALYNYYEKVIVPSRKEVEDSTPEGTLVTICKSIAMEIGGVVPATELYYTNSNYHKYKVDIEYNKNEGWFELNSVHIKCFMEENNPGDLVFIRQVGGYVKRAYGITSAKRKVTTIENEDLIKDLKCTRVKVSVFRFEIRKVLKPKIRPTAEEVLNPIPKGDKF